MQATPRLVQVDVARGLFLYWMIVAHALTLAELGVHPLQWMRPAGWATHCFVLLSGFAIAAVFRDGDRPRANAVRRLRRRALEVGAVAIASNLFYQVSEGLVLGTLRSDVVLASVLFHAPWSVSRILIPTALVLALGPALLALSARIPARALFAAATLAGVALDAAVSATSGPLRDWAPYAVFLGGTRGPGIPIVPFVVLGVWGFALAVATQSLRHRETWIPFAIAGGLLLWIAPAAALPGAGFLHKAAHFTLAFAAVQAIRELGGFGAVERPLALLGRSALLVFVMHRAVIQAIRIVFGSGEPSVALFVAMVLGALAACGAASLWRERDPRVGRMLRRLGL